jgi:hypothetical protein
MRLPDSWVNALFARLTVRYGSGWTRMWEGIDPAAVRADWAEELGGFEQRPGAIKYGLDNLPPDRPPTVQQFRSICNRVPEAFTPELPPPKADPAVVQRVKVGLDPQGRQPLAWAYAMKAREARGDRLTPFQRAAWREALPMEAA